jgi:Magnesium chelatase, subunit ChlI
MVRTVGSPRLSFGYIAPNPPSLLSWGSMSRWLATILPAMTLPEAVETIRIHSIADPTRDRVVFVTTHPFHAPTTPSSMCS